LNFHLSAFVDFLLDSIDLLIDTFHTINKECIGDILPVLDEPSNKTFKLRLVLFGFHNFRFGGRGSWLSHSSPLHVEHFDFGVA